MTTANKPALVEALCSVFVRLRRPVQKARVEEK